MGKSKAYELGKAACVNNSANAYSEDRIFMMMVKAAPNKAAQLINDWDRGWKIAAIKMQPPSQSVKWLY